MKRLIFILTLGGLAHFTIYAQTETQSFDVNGIKVIFKPTPNKVINVRLYFRGGVTNYPASQAGIEDITLNATTQCGTSKYSPKAFRDTASAYDIWLSGESNVDYGYIQVNCISKYFNLGWSLFTEAVINPVFNKDDVELLKDRQIASNRNYESSADVQLENLQMRNAFANTPYATDPDGSEETIKKLTADDLKNYYQMLLNKNRIFIVVVGNISKQELFEKILSSFGNIPSRPYSEPNLEAPVWNDNKLIAESKPLATNYFSAIMNAPGYTDVNFVPFRLGLSGLGGNLYAYLRSELNLTYNPSTIIFQLRMPFAEMYAGSTNPQQAIAGMMIVLKRIQTKGLNDEWLQHIKNTYITSAYIKEQSSSAIASNLGKGEILGGWQYADDLTKLVQMTTVEQVNTALNTYITGLKWTYLGNTDAIEGFTPPPY